MCVGTLSSRLREVTKLLVEGVVGVGCYGCESRNRSRLMDHWARRDGDMCSGGDRKGARRLREHSSMTCTAPPACFSISRGPAHPLRAKRRAAPDVVDLTERLADGCINAGRFAGAAGGPTGGERAGGVARLLRVATSTHGVSAMTFSAGCFMPATFFVARNLRIVLWMCVVEDRVGNTANRAQPSTRNALDGDGAALACLVEVSVAPPPLASAQSGPFFSSIIHVRPFWRAVFAAPPLIRRPAAVKRPQRQQDGLVAGGATVLGHAGAAQLQELSPRGQRQGSRHRKKASL